MIRKLWTDEKPTQSGYYWLKRSVPDKTRDVAEVVLIRYRRVYPITISDFRYEVKGKHKTLNAARLADVEGKWHGPVPFPSLHQANKYEQGLKELTVTVIDCLAALESVMTQHESAERGSKVAKISSALEFANDRALHLSLGMEFQSMNALKRKRVRLLRKGK